MFLPPATAHASLSDPSQWPEFSGADPELTATAHTIRFSGPDRYQTNLAMGLALRGTGDFPFDTSDRTSDNASGLAQANDWWGAATCPRSIIVVAGDTFADALAAASLSDPTDRSAQPRVQRVAAADPLFDPIGGYDRPDTAYAPVVVTTSGRSGATSLATTARLTATDLVKGGCTTAKEAIIVGGTNAVPKGVESDLIGIGYREVFRVAGDDRYETAANVAQAMGTSEPTSDSCLDTDAADGTVRLGWYGNAVAEYRFDAQTCRLLPRAVVLAEGGTGADALAAGWWTSYWQVPILLTAPDGTLPQATRVALQTLEVDTVIVLGGVARIPERTVDEARFLAGAVAGRIAGDDRSATSIEMAKAFGGWQPTGRSADFAGDQACFVTSSGNGPSASGWPDALAAGPLCGRIGATGRGSPKRGLAPVDGPGASIATTGGVRPAHDAVPELILPTGDASLPPALDAFLSATLPPDSNWCSGIAAPTGCSAPAFGVLVGGDAAIPRAAATALTSRMSGGMVTDGADESPSMTGAFPTALDLGPDFRLLGPSGEGAICVLPGGLDSVRWLARWGDEERRIFIGESDVMTAAAYEDLGQSEPLCVPTQTGSRVAVTGVSLSGHTTTAASFDLSSDRHVALSDTIRGGGTRTFDSAGRTTWTLAGPPSGSVAILEGADSQPVTDARLELTLSVGAQSGRANISGTFAVATALGATTGEVIGIAVRTGGGWELAGLAVSGPFGDRQALGGFRATIAESPESAISGTWRFDGY